MAIGKISIDVEARVAKLESDIGRAARVMQREMERATQRSEAAMRQMRVSMEREMEKIRGAAGRAGAAIIGFFSIRAGVTLARDLGHVADQYANIQARVRLAAGENANLARSIAAVYGVAQRTSNSLEATANMVQRGSTALRNFGMQADHAFSAGVALAEVFNKALVVSGSNSEMAAAAAQQFSQALASGRFQGDEFRSVMENNTRFAQLLADSLGVNIAKLRELSAAGKLGTADMLGLLKRTKELDDEFARMPITIGRAKTQLDNAFTKFIGEADQAAGASRTVADAILFLANNLSQITGAIILGTQVLAAYLVLMKGVPTIMTAATAMIYGTRDAIIANSLAMEMGIATAFNWANAIRMAAGSVFALFAGWQVGTYLRNEFRIIAEAGNYLVFGLVQGWDTLTYATGLVWEGIKFSALSAFDFVLESFAGMLRSIASAGDVEVFGTKLLGDLPEGVNALADSISGALVPMEDYKAATAELGDAYAKATAENQKMLADMQDATAANFAAKDAAKALNNALAPLPGNLNLVAQAAGLSEKELQKLRKAGEQAAIGLAKTIDAVSARLGGPLIQNAFKFKEAMSELAAQEKALHDAGMLNVEMTDRLATARRLLTEEYNREAQAIQNAIQPHEEYLIQMREDIELIGLSIEQRNMLNTVRGAEDALARSSISTTSAEGQQYLQTVTALETYRQAKEAAAAASEKFRSIVETGMNSVADAIGEVITGGIKSMKDFGKTLTDIAKRMVAQMIAEFIKLKVIAPLLRGLFSGGGGWGAAAMGAMGLGAAGSAFAGGGSGGGGGGGFDWTSLISGGGGFGGSGGMNLMNPSTYTGLLYGSGQTSALGSMMGVANYGPGMATTWTPTGMGAAAGYAAGAAGAYYGLTQRGSSTGSGGSIAAGLSYGALGLGAVGAIGGIAGGAGAIAGATGAFASLGAAAWIPVIGWIAAIAALVDLISGGRLFGTRYRAESSESILRLGAEGGTAEASIREVRQRSLFRGREWRTKPIDPSDEAMQAADDFFRQIQDVMENSARQLGTDVPPMIDAALRVVQEYDKKGKVKSTKIFVDILGRSWEEADEQLAATRIAAESIIATIDYAMTGASAAITGGLETIVDSVNEGVGGTGGSGGHGAGRMPGIDQLEKSAEVLTATASEVAERWRGDAELLMAGAQFLLVAATDIMNGTALLGDTATLLATTDLVEDMQRGDESLIQTYQRLAQAASLLDEALRLSNVSLDMTREEVVRFASDIADAAGGIEQAQQLWSTFFENFYDQSNAALERTAQAVEQTNAMLAPLGFDSNTTREQFRLAFEAALPTLTPEEIVQWLQAAAALDAIRDSAESLMAQVDAIIAGAAPMPTFQDHLAELNRQFDEMSAAGMALGLTQEELLRIEQARQIATQELIEAMARAMMQYNQLFTDLEMEEFGSEFQQELHGISQWVTETTARANELARAAGMQAAREEDLARVHTIAASRAARAIAQLEAAGRELAAELYGTPLSRVEQQIAELEQSSNAASSAMSDFSGAAMDVANGMSEATRLLLGEFSPLRDMEKLPIALEALRRGEASAEDVLGIGRRLFASGSDYNQLFDEVMRIVGSARQGGAVGGPSGVLASSGQSSAELQRLYQERDRLLGEQDAAQRFGQATQLAQILADAAGFREQDFETVAASMGFTLDQLMRDLNIDSLAGLQDYLIALQADSYSLEDMAAMITAGEQLIVDTLRAIATMDMVKPLDGRTADPYAKIEPAETRDTAVQEELAMLREMVGDLLAQIAGNTGRTAVEVEGLASDALQARMQRTSMQVRSDASKPLSRSGR